MRATLLTAFLLVASVALADEPKSPAKEGELPVIAAPSFDEPLDSTFSVAKGSWTPAKGILTAVEVPADKHVAVLHHNVGLSSAVIELEFKLDGSPAFLVGCDGKKGHVGRVVVKPTGVDIAEDSAKPPCDRHTENASRLRAMAPVARRVEAGRNDRDPGRSNRQRQA